MIRIVKMHFRNEAVNQFLELYSKVEPLISSFEGCRSVKLMRDINNPSLFFTISDWEGETSLNNYRRSILFNETWAKTKALFAFKAEAWSLEEAAFKRSNSVA